MLVAPGVHRFNTDPFNWYVIEEGGRLTLVDAGFPGHYHVFRDGLRAIGREMKDVEAVILTHAHADHMGFADRVSQLASAPVYIHENDIHAATSVLQLPWLSPSIERLEIVHGIHVDQCFAKRCFQSGPHLQTCALP